MEENLGMHPKSRRDFMKEALATTAAAGAMTLGVRAARAQDKKTVKAGLIGCGGRGTGAIANCVEAGKYAGIDVQVSGLCDAFGDRAKRLARSYNVDDERVYLGFEAYKKLLQSDVELILLATPPAFRPV